MLPICFAIRRAAKESAVSPDWLIMSTSVPSSKIGLRYLNSLATSTSTGILDKPSKIYFAVTPVWYAEPQATIIIFLIALISSSVIFSSSITTLPSCNLGFKVSATAFGCSYTSFNIKCSYPPFSAASTSHSICVDSFVSSSSYILKNFIESSFITAISSLSIKYTSLVYFNTAGTSDAIKLPSWLFPTINGLSLRTAYRVSGSSANKIPKA